MTNTPPSATRPADDTADAPLGVPLDWAAVVEQQQRWWTEWLEAGQLWTSWWFSQWPAFGWPPVGVVLPPAGTVADLAPRAPKAEAMPTAADLVRPRSARAPIGARHH